MVQQADSWHREYILLLKCWAVLSKTYMRSMFPWQAVRQQQNNRSCLLFIMWVNDWCRYTASNLTDGTYTSRLLCPLWDEVKDNGEARKMIINNHGHSHWLFHWAFEDRNSLSRRTRSDKRIPNIWTTWHREAAQVPFGFRKSRTDDDEMMGMKSASCSANTKPRL